MSRSTGVLLCLLGLAVGCGSETPTIPSVEEPFLYLVLNQRGVQAEGRQHGLLITVGTPLESRYITADRFLMRRVSDGTRFDWRHRPDRVGTAPVGSTGGSLADGNYLLPETGENGLLGAQDLVPGTSVQLVIEIEGRTIQGNATIPDSVNPRVIDGESGARLVWSDVAGAGGYSIDVDDDTEPPRLQEDTVFRLSEGFQESEVELQSIDPELFRYLTEDDARRAGIDSGFGVFGAILPVTTTVASPAEQEASQTEEHR